MLAHCVCSYIRALFIVLILLTPTAAFFLNWPEIAVNQNYVLYPIPMPRCSGAAPTHLPMLAPVTLHIIPPKKTKTLPHLSLQKQVIKSKLTPPPLTVPKRIPVVDFAKPETLDEWTWGSDNAIGGNVIH